MVDPKLQFGKRCAGESSLQFTALLSGAWGQYGESFEEQSGSTSNEEETGGGDSATDFSSFDSSGDDDDGGTTASIDR